MIDALLLELRRAGEALQLHDAAAALQLAGVADRVRSLALSAADAARLRAAVLALLTLAEQERACIADALSALASSRRAGAAYHRRAEP